MNTATENLVTVVDKLEAAIRDHDPGQHAEANEPQQSDTDLEPEQEAEIPAEENDPEQEENEDEDEVSDADTDDPPSPDQTDEAVTGQEETGDLPAADPEADTCQESPADDPPATSHPDYNRIINVPLDDRLIPDPDTPRQMARGEDEMGGFTSNIARMGVLNPILIKQVGNQLIVIDGWHRVTAAKKAGLPTVPARFAQLENSGQQLAVSIVLNSLQKSLNPLETAEGYERLVNLGLTQKEIALRAGVSESSVSNHRKLNALIPEVKKAYREGKIKLKQAGLSVLAKKTPEEQRAELGKICGSGSQGNGENAGQGLISVSREPKSPLADRIKRLKSKVEGISNADNHWALISRELTDLQATIARILAANTAPAAK